jgi:cytochrome P450
MRYYDDPEIPVIRLDPTGADHHGEAARLRDAGPVVRVILPGEVRAWAVTSHKQLLELVKDDRVSKDYRDWTAYNNGSIPADWPLIGMLTVDNMVTRNGAEHRRLRRLVTQTLTRRRIEELRPRITEIVEELLDALPAHAGPDGAVDLRQHFAVQVPMQVICELVGLPQEQRPQLRHLVDSIFRSTTTPEEVVATQHDRKRLLEDLVTFRSENPGEDLTSALIAARANDPDALNDAELADTLWLMVTAGHETTMSLIVNAVHALLTHPDQRTLALAGDDDTWAAVVEETLRFDAPIGNFMARYHLRTSRSRASPSRPARPSSPPTAPSDATPRSTAPTPTNSTSNESSKKTSPSATALTSASAHPSPGSKPPSPSAPCSRTTPTSISLSRPRTSPPWSRCSPTPETNCLSS